MERVGSWDRHPDKGYIHKWSPESGPVLFVWVPSNREETSEVVDQLGMKALTTYSKYQQSLGVRVKLGQITEADAGPLKLKEKAKLLRGLLREMSNY